jgi:hypothetical protein
MKTTFPTRLVSPKVITAVSRNGSSLRFTYGDGTSEDIDLLVLGHAIRADLEAEASSQVAQNTITMIAIDSTSVEQDGDISITGNIAYMRLKTSRQIT